MHCCCDICLVCVCGMCTQEKLKALVWASQAFQEQPAEMEALWDSCSCLLYSLEDGQKQLGLGDKVGVQANFGQNYSAC